MSDRPLQGIITVGFGAGGFLFAVAFYEGMGWYFLGITLWLAGAVALEALPRRRGGSK